MISELLSPRNAHYDFEKEVGSGMETVFTISGADPSQKTNHMLRYVAINFVRNVTNPLEVRWINVENLESNSGNRDEGSTVNEFKTLQVRVLQLVTLVIRWWGIAV